MAPVARLPPGSTVPQCAPFYLPCPHGEDRGGRSWGLGQNNSIQFNSAEHLLGDTASLVMEHVSVLCDASLA